MNDRKLSSRFRTTFTTIAIGVAVLTAIGAFLMVVAEVYMVAIISILVGGLILMFIVILMGNSLAQSVIKPIKEIAEGNFNHKDYDELGQISQQMREVGENLEKLREFTLKVEQNAQRGHIAASPIRNELKGTYLEIAEATNRILVSVSNDIGKISSALGNIGDGQLLAALNAGVGGSLARPLENLSKSLQALYSDIIKFADKDGSNQNPIPADRYRGNWHEMATSLNKTKQLTDNHLTQAIEALSALGKGNFTAASLHPESGGQLVRHANAFNKTVEQLSRQVETICRALGEKSKDRRITGEFPGDFAKIRIAMEVAPEKPIVQPKAYRLNDALPANSINKKITTIPRKTGDTGIYRQMSGVYKAPVTSSTGSRAKDYLKSDFGKY